MSKSFSFSLNDNEIIEASNVLGVTQENFGKSIKTLLLEKKSSSVYPKKIFEVAFAQKEELEKMTPVEKAAELSDKEIDKILNIRGGNSRRKLKAAGLYYKKNIEDYMADFIMWWNGDMGKINELTFTVNDFTWREYVALEYAKRKTKGLK